MVRAGSKKWGVCRRFCSVLCCTALFLSSPSFMAPVYAESRLKDVVDFEGVRDNLLIGYGLVVGLNGSGDSLTNSPFTEKSLVGMLERLGVNTRGSSMKTKNVAAVMVTATLPPFSSQGSKVDVVVSTLGDAKSLAGGTLLVTPLLGADGEVYAVAQGALAVGGFAAEGQGTTVTKGVPTSGRIANGAIVEREIPFRLADLGSMRLSLRNPDFTTANRVAEAINKGLKGDVAVAQDAATVRVLVPDGRRNDVVGLMTQIEQLTVAPDQVARVVIDEQSGVIVMGENVRINTVAIAQGNLTIRITETPQVSQPAPFSQGGQTEVVARTNVEVDEGEAKKMGVLDTGVSLQEMVQSLNALGIGPRDMITILQSIKAAGALQADLEVI
ncbi:MAG: flagellar basal body P-ring protein FlgI [Proteobacteria bacterium]|nr:flagellar basal body P-ring protein FlgI [Alphaproteobacteria bacterium]NCC03528.1 flagellar basal body P-ring protein FlgI [Pseudomonadota bacterium]